MVNFKKVVSMAVVFSLVLSSCGKDGASSMRNQLASGVVEREQNAEQQEFDDNDTNAPQAKSDYSASVEESKVKDINSLQSLVDANALSRKGHDDDIPQIIIGYKDRVEAKIMNDAIIDHKLYAMNRKLSATETKNTDVSTKEINAVAKLNNAMYKDAVFEKVKNIAAKKEYKVALKEYKTIVEECILVQEELIGILEKYIGYLVYLAEKIIETKGKEDVKALIEKLTDRLKVVREVKAKLEKSKVSKEEEITTIENDIKVIEGKSDRADLEVRLATVETKRIDAQAKADAVIKEIEDMDNGAAIAELAALVKKLKPALKEYEIVLEEAIGVQGELKDRLEKYIIDLLEKYKIVAKNKQVVVEGLAEEIAISREKLAEVIEYGNVLLKNLKDLLEEKITNANEAEKMLNDANEAKSPAVLSNGTFPNDDL